MIGQISLSSPKNMVRSLICFYHYAKVLVGVFIDAFPRLNQFQMGPEERNGMKQNQCGKRNEQNFERNRR
jgi:hypothetical protein